MKNILAKKLIDAADKYLSEGLKHDCNPSIYRRDHEDLISIANMIENNESEKAIAKAMWGLDTAVRDIIPDQVYNIYNN